MTTLIYNIDRAEVKRQTLSLTPEHHQVHLLKLHRDSAGLPSVHHGSVHLPERIVEHLKQGNVRTIYVTVVGMNSPASRALSGRPELLVTRVRLRSGALENEVPHELRCLRWRLLVLGTVWVAAAIALLVSGGPKLMHLAGGVAMSVGMFRWATAWDLPLSPPDVAASSS
ncbi:hypothetical protein [Roseateles noduli]|uniref:hypothetical protein n=1 Tax=Roseateles noduli TaxID=2052484 RepID=UPI003D655C89